ncbi:hypothetical protein SDC9_181892 [bioreactor metagenome]|uniref:Uncharacterized protein n=1 Tax=bioreactor metagenome TaxID=1076179 RepID=A0A645H8I3_9ZZZZ
MRAAGVVEDQRVPGADEPGEGAGGAQAQDGMLERHRQAQADPLRAEAGDETGQARLVHLVRLVGPVGQAERRVRRPVELRGQRVPDRGAQHGAAVRLHQHRPFSLLAEHHAWNSATYRLCSASVAAYLVSPVSGLTVTKKSHGPLAGWAAASRAALPGASIGVGGRPVCR